MGRRNGQMIARTSLALIGVLALCLVGCGMARMYEGPDRPDDEIATVSCDFIQSFYVVRSDICGIVQVDGVWTDPQMYIYGAELLPGTHSMSFRYAELGAIAPGIATSSIPFSGLLKFEVEAGHTYRLHFDEVDDQWYAWIEDEGTGEVIAGIQP